MRKLNIMLPKAITKRIDDLQCTIEKDSLTKDQPKIGYLRGLDDLLKKFVTCTETNSSMPPIFLWH